MRESTLRELTLRLKNAAPTLQLEENADMARYTTLHLGGPADLMANPDDPAQIPLLIETARALDVPVTVIGNGSNLLVRSGGIRGLVIRICRNLRGVEVNGDRIRAQAGTMMSSLSMAAADCDLGRLEESLNHQFEYFVILLLLLGCQLIRSQNDEVKL